MLFNMRSGITSRLTGFVITTVLFTLAAAPVPLIATVPSFLPAALLLLFGYDISVEWLLFSWPKISPLEFLLVYVTLVLLIVKGLQMGLLLGLVGCGLAFAAQIGHASVVAVPGMVSQGSTARPLRERQVLECFTGKALPVLLYGYIFFGSSLRVAWHVQKLAKRLAEYSEVR